MGGAGGEETRMVAPEQQRPARPYPYLGAERQVLASWEQAHKLGSAAALGCRVATHGSGRRQARRAAPPPPCAILHCGLRATVPGAPLTELRRTLRQSFSGGRHREPR